VHWIPKSLRFASSRRQAGPDIRGSCSKQKVNWVNWRKRIILHPACATYFQRDDAVGIRAVEMPSWGWLAGLGRFNFRLANDQPVLDGNTLDEAEITGLLRCLRRNWRLRRQSPFLPQSSEPRRGLRHIHHPQIVRHVQRGVSHAPAGGVDDEYFALGRRDW